MTFELYNYKSGLLSYQDNLWQFVLYRDITSSMQITHIRMLCDLGSCILPCIQVEVCQELYDTIRNHKNKDGRVLCEAFIRVPKRR